MAVEYFSVQYLIWATAIGALSAVSLPLGSVLGLQTRPRPQFIAVLAAFGAGALLAALSVELVAPTVFALGDGGTGSHGGDSHRNFYALIAGAVLGGILFFMLDQLVNAHGGFLRKTATSIAYFDLGRRRRQAQFARELARFPLLRDLSPDHNGTLMYMIRPVTFGDGEVISVQGDDTSDLLFILEGTVRMTRDGNVVSEFGPGEVVGIGHLVMQVSNLGSGVAAGDVVGLALAREDFERLREIAPEFDQACLSLTAERLEVIEQKLTSRWESATKWVHQATAAVKSGAQLPSSDQLQRARQDHPSAPLAIWLGILLDGIPESFVIGAGVLVILQAKAQVMDSVTFGAIIPYTLIAGLFLSNLPEALASSANMRIQGWGKSRIFTLWMSLMIITAIGAGLGYLLADNLDHAMLIFAEGLAAGAMLTMIASAMIPEAIHLGNANAVGLSTLAGFLSAISFKLLE
jgi:CRP-like cAMP-binding protein